MNQEITLMFVTQKPYFAAAHNNGVNCCPPYYFWLTNLLENLNTFENVIEGGREIGYSTTQLKKFIKMLIELYGNPDEIETIQGLTFETSNLYDFILNAPSYATVDEYDTLYQNDSGTYKVHGFISDFLTDWFKTLIPRLPQHVVIPRINIFEVDNVQLIQWISSTTVEEQVKFLTMLEDLNIDWTEYHTSHGVVPETTIHI